MAKTIYKSPGSRFTVEFEYSSQKELFEKVAEFQEIFEEDTCGACKSNATKFGVREVDGNKYYEKKCVDCGSALSYGQNKTGGSLFPKRKDNDGNWDNKNKGWNRWTPNRKDDDESGDDDDAFDVKKGRTPKKK